jgi:DNA-binding winged helix-turn-helix (wHTH) protein/TolB-like protein/tetratricopeptide (TPR) repeat protein
MRAVTLTGPAQTPASNKVLRIGDWVLDAGTHRLRRGSEERILEPKEFAVLIQLAEAAPAFVSTDDLLARAWPKTIVVSNAVHQVIRRLRQCFDEDARSPRYIETLPRRGYRLIVPVGEHPLATMDDAAGTTHQPSKIEATPSKRSRHWVAAAVLLGIGTVLAVAGWWHHGAGETAASPVSSVAVLPLTGVGLPADSAWLTHGIASELTSMLATIPTLKVASQAEAFAHSGSPANLAGRRLGVEGLLLGSLHATSEGLEVKMELVRTQDAGVLWRESFRGSMDDPLTLQTSLAARIFRYFGETVSEYGLMRPTTAAAHVAHLKRLLHWLTGNPAAEREWAEMTVALEPTFAMGHVNLVWPYLYAALDERDGPWKSKIREALDTAARLGISNTASYKAHEGLYQWVLEGNLDSAERLLRDSFVAGDAYGRLYYARLLASSGIHEPPRKVLERLTVSEPHALLYWDILAQQRGYAGDYSGAIEALERALTLSGENFYIIEKLVLAHLARRDVSAARQALDRRRKLAVSDWRLKSLEALVRSHAEPEATDPLELAESLAAELPSWPTALLLLSSSDPRAAQRLADDLAAAVAGPGWGKYWVDEIEWAMSPAERGSSTWEAFRRALGYTDDWRLEACRRMAHLPPDLGLSCDPGAYEASSHPQGPA